jgi:ferredoxin
MEKNIIFYFSGTGNSYQVAKDLSSQLTNCEAINMAGFDYTNLKGINRMGFVFPTYFWGIPNIVKKFLSEIKINKETYTFAIATCGGTLGASLSQTDGLLKLQGKRLDAGFYIIMPENYILMYDADLPDKQERLFTQEKDKIKSIIETVKAKNHIKYKHSKYIIDGLIGKQVNQLVLKNYPNKDKGFTVNDDCIGCGKCQRACSVKNVKIVDGKPEWQHHCEFCMGCLQSCPKSAINWKNKTDKRKRYYNPNVLHEVQ